VLDTGRRNHRAKSLCLKRVRTCPILASKEARNFQRNVPGEKRGEQQHGVPPRSRQTVSSHRIPLYTSMGETTILPETKQEGVRGDLIEAR
ncbi:unnamed protein product, partial [Ectocarpus sp. 4 AP-2014]